MNISIRPPSYNVDVVMCIDKTGSMQPFLGKAKHTAKLLCENFREKMDAESKLVSKFRVKVIGFGDYGIDPEPMLISNFFTLPDDNDAFEAFLNGITAEGGGDAPENALEALAHAIKSDWTEDGDVRRHVTMLFTDTTALELGVRTPTGSTASQLKMPKNLPELGEWWEEMKVSAKRLVVFAPNGYPWDDIAASLENVIYIPITASDGCCEIDFDEVVNALVLSCGAVGQ